MTGERQPPRNISSSSEILRTVALDRLGERAAPLTAGEAFAEILSEIGEQLAGIREAFFGEAFRAGVAGEAGLDLVAFDLPFGGDALVDPWILRAL